MAEASNTLRTLHLSVKNPVRLRFRFRRHNKADTVSH